MDNNQCSNEFPETSSRAVSMRRLDTFIWGCRPIGSVLSQIVSDLQKGGHHA